MHSSHAAVRQHMISDILKKKGFERDVYNEWNFDWTSAIIQNHIWRLNNCNNHFFNKYKLLCIFFCLKQWLMKWCWYTKCNFLQESSSSLLKAPAAMINASSRHLPPLFLLCAPKIRQRIHEKYTEKAKHTPLSLCCASLKSICMLVWIWCISSRLKWEDEEPLLKWGRKNGL